MHRLLRWAAVVAAMAGLWGLVFTRSDLGGPPGDREREAHVRELRRRIASQKMPDPNALEAQRRQLQAEVGAGEGAAQGGSGRSPPAASVTGTVEWVGEDELIVRDPGGVERELQVRDGTRFRRRDRAVSRRAVEEGAGVWISYDVEQGEWVAREVELIRLPPLPPLPQSEPG